MIYPKVLAINAFGRKSIQIKKKYIWSHLFHAFLATFPSKTFSYISAIMFLISFINYKIEEKIKLYTFASLIFSKSSPDGNQSVFKDLNIIQRFEHCLNRNR